MLAIARKIGIPESKEPEMPIVERKLVAMAKSNTKNRPPLTSLLGVCAQSQCRDGGEMLKRDTH